MPWQGTGPSIPFNPKGFVMRSHLCPLLSPQSFGRISMFRNGLQDFMFQTINEK